MGQKRKRLLELVNSQKNYNFLQDRLFDILFICALLVFGIAAIFSSGYHQADEHYQIIEFARYKLGLAKIDDLAWEFRYQIRPGIQVFVCYVIFLVSHFIGITDPYILAMFLRLFMGILAAVVIRQFVKVTIKDILPQYQFCYLFFSYFLWFIPYISVRFSSETFSGILFLFALTQVISHLDNLSVWRLLCIGFIFGLSIIIRFQSAIMLSGAISWMIYQHIIDKSKLFCLIGSVLVALIFGLLIDRWLYGEWVFTFYNYFYINIYRDFASYFGTLPWYQYGIFLIFKPFVVIGVLMCISYVLFLYHNPRSFVTWITLPFLVIHSLIPHKEPRFIFPVIFFLPLIIIEGLGIINKSKLSTTAINILFATIIFINNIILFTVLIKPAGNGEIGITKFIKDNYQGRVHVIFTSGANPYNPWKSVYSSFYVDNKVSTSEISSIWDRRISKLKKSNQANFLVIKSSELTGERSLSLLNKYKLQKVSLNFASGILNNLESFNPDFNDNSLLLYQFEN